MKAAAEKVGTHRVFCASFTRAASAELASRVEGFPREAIGTLHAHGYRALGRPKLINADALRDWNSQYRGLALPLDLYDKAGGADDGAYETDPFDEESAESVHRRYQTLRNRRVPSAAWPESVALFGERWSAWKREVDVIDYTDMVDLALQHTERAPNNPSIGFFDEVQDFTPLELALARHWGAEMDQIVLAGDDDQTLYGFKGASVEAFLDSAVTPAGVITLQQSYRVPRTVHAAATQWISQVRRRQPKPYRPRDAEGTVRVAWDVEFADGEALVRLAEEILATGRTVLFLADAARMLLPLIDACRSAGLPFHNPLATRRGDWNPLRTGGHGVTSAQRVLALSRWDEQTWGDQARPWTAAELAAWVDALKADGLLARGAKAGIKRLDDPYDFEDLARLFVDGDAEGGSLERAAACDLDWYEAHLTGEYAKRMRFPLAVARARGVPVLEQTPRVALGTIHSYKGGEADVVVLCPDLSLWRHKAWVGADDATEDVDSVRRLFYVGMTRARDELIIAGPSARGRGRHIEPHELLGGVA